MRGTDGTAFVQRRQINGRAITPLLTHWSYCPVKGLWPRHSLKCLASDLHNAGASIINHSFIAWISTPSVNSPRPPPPQTTLHSSPWKGYVYSTNSYGSILTPLFNGHLKATCFPSIAAQVCTTFYLLQNLLAACLNFWGFVGQMLTSPFNSCIIPCYTTGWNFTMSVLATWKCWVFITTGKLSRHHGKS